MIDYSKVYLEERSYKKWSRSAIYYGIVACRAELGLPRLKKAYIIPQFSTDAMRKEFLRKTGSRDGKDLYGFNMEVVRAITDESLQEAFIRSLPEKKRPKPNPWYRIEYVAVWPDRYDIVQEDVEVYEKLYGVKAFHSSIDGKEHRLNERNLKIIEKLPGKPVTENGKLQNGHGKCVTE